MANERSKGVPVGTIGRVTRWGEGGFGFVRLPDGRQIYFNRFGRRIPQVSPGSDQIGWVRARAETSSVRVGVEISLGTVVLGEKGLRAWSWCLRCDLDTARECVAAEVRRRDDAARRAAEAREREEMRRREQGAVEDPSDWREAVSHGWRPTKMSPATSRRGRRLKRQVVLTRDRPNGGRASRTFTVRDPDEIAELECWLRPTPRLVNAS